MDLLMNLNKMFFFDIMKIISLLYFCAFSVGNSEVDVFNFAKYSNDILASTERDDGVLNFLVIGDWGGLPVFPYRTPVESQIALKMGEFASKENSKFFLGLGDNFYFNGVTSSEDPRFQETFEDVFTADSLQSPWFMLAGNHDHHGNVTAQLLYSSKSKRWNFPELYYKLKFEVSRSTLEIYMIDTVILCGNTDDGDVTQPKGPENLDLADQQIAWLTQQLSQSRADYLFVAGHYPVYSIASHGPTECLINNVMPLLHKYNVSAYVCGHDHDLQHLVTTYKNVTVDYFVSGASNFIDPSIAHKDTVPKDSLRFYWNNIFSFGGFASVSVDAEMLKWTFLEYTGKELYSQTIYPRHIT